MCAQYVEFSRHAADYIHNGGYDLTKSHAWYGFFSLLLGHDSTLVKSLTLVAMLITIGITAYSLRGPLMPRQSRFAQQFSVLILCSILISPHVYTYDLTMLLLPLGFIVREMNVACVQEQKITLTSHSSQSIHIMGLLLFCLAGVAPKFAGFTGFQLTVPLMFLLLLAMRGSTPTSIISRWFTTGLSHM